MNTRPVIQCYIQTYRPEFSPALLRALQVSVIWIFLSICLKTTQTLLYRITDCRVSCFSLHVVYQFEGDDTAVYCSSPDSSHVEMEGGPRQLGHSAADCVWRLAGLQSACIGFHVSWRFPTVTWWLDAKNYLNRCWQCTAVVSWIQ